MADLQTEPPPVEQERDEPSSPPGDRRGSGLLVAIGGVAAAIAVPALTYLLLNSTFTAVTGRVPGALVGVIAILIGVVGVFAMYTVIDRTIGFLPGRLGERIQPYAWAGPAVVVLSIYLIYPAVNTVQLSFMNSTATEFVGWENYAYVFSDPSMLRSLRNTVLWIFIVPAGAVSVGLVFAVLADKLSRGEALAKSIIFLPMAISFVGASIVWRFIYSFRIEGVAEQVGILNAVRVASGSSPVDWLELVPWNNLFLMVIMIWLQGGFAMVILSSAIKGVPEDRLEAARIDGATEFQVFWQIVVPSIMSSIVVVFTTMVIGVLKVFDIVWVMTGGRAGTEVIAFQMIRNMFTFRDFGRGSAIAVFMFVAVIPVMIINIRRFREEEATR